MTARAATVPALAELTWLCMKGLAWTRVKPAASRSAVVLPTSFNLQGMHDMVTALRSSWNDGDRLCTSSLHVACTCTQSEDKKTQALHGGQPC